jgi:hypothetical protein
MDCRDAPTDVSVSREEFPLHQNVIGKFHDGGIPAHVDSMPIGCFRELLFGTSLEGAATADWRWRRRFTGIGA